MRSIRPYALSIAGFDPSGGAGLLSDIKTMEASDVYGLGVVSALTYQNDITFERLEWTAPEKILQQLRVLQDRFSIQHIKIGLIEDFGVLKQLTGWIQEHIPGAIMVWDPVLKASAGFSFHDLINHRLFSNLLSCVACLTPNKPEAQQLFGADGLHERLLEQSRQTAVYLKGGHDSGTSTAADMLYYRQRTYTFSNPRLPRGEKHGSGCVLSSALTAGLALGMDMPAAAQYANTYTHQFLASNETLLGYHSFINNSHEKNK